MLSDIVCVVWMCYFAHKCNACSVCVVMLFRGKDAFVFYNSVYIIFIVVDLNTSFLCGCVCMSVCASASFSEYKRINLNVFLFIVIVAAL